MHVTRFVMALVLISALVAVGHAQEQTTIKVAHWFGGVDLENANKAIERFEREHPNIRVEVEIIPHGQYYDAMLVRSAGGVLPDVVMTIASRAQFWIDQGIILQDLSPFIQREDDAFDFEDYWPQVMPAFSDERGGVYALPYDISMFALWHNADMLLEAGIVPPATDEVWTWDQFLDAARRVTRDRNGDGETDQWGTWNMPRASMGLFAFLGHNNGRIFSEDKRTAVISSPEVAEVYEWWVDARFQYGITPPPGATIPQRMYSGAYGFALEGPWMIPEMRANANFTYDAAPLPQGERRYNVVDGGSFGMGKGSQNAEAAWEFIKFYTSRENLEQVIGLPGRGIPGRISAAPSFVTDQMPDEWVFLNEIYISEPVGQLAPPNYFQLERLIHQTTQAVFNGTEPVRSALETLETDLNARLREYYAERDARN